MLPLPVGKGLLATCGQAESVARAPRLPGVLDATGVSLPNRAGVRRRRGRPDRLSRPYVGLFLHRQAEPAAQEDIRALARHSAFIPSPEGTGASAGSHAKHLRLLLYMHGRGPATQRWASLRQGRHMESRLPRLKAGDADWLPLKCFRLRDRRFTGRSECSRAVSGGPSTGRATPTRPAVPPSR
jgi:hypothetical protein